MMLRTFKQSYYATFEHFEGYKIAEQYRFFKYKVYINIA